MANPTPEIDYDLAMAAREDIIGNGSHDHPNQVNNVLASRFRGAMDVRATKINEDEAGATHALANLAKEPVPEQVNMHMGN
jgi:malate dehydrogenase (oxaloacetate-decarboxylating)(NADP+)